MIKIRATQADLFSCRPGEIRSFVMDQHSINLARQLIYNRGVKYRGLDIALTKKSPIYNNNGLFIVECERLSYGKTIDGFDEPKDYMDYDYSTVKARRRARKEADEANQ